MNGRFFSIFVLFLILLLGMIVSEIFRKGKIITFIKLKNEIDNFRVLLNIKKNYAFTHLSRAGIEGMV